MPRPAEGTGVADARSHQTKRRCLQTQNWSDGRSGLSGDRHTRRRYGPILLRPDEVQGQSRDAGSSLTVTSIPWRRREAVVALLDQPCHVQAGQIVVLASDDLDADGQAERQPDRRNGRGQVVPAGIARPEELIDDRLRLAWVKDQPIK